jgi:hypothetical protein
VLAVCLAPRTSQEKPLIDKAWKDPLAGTQFVRPASEFDTDSWIIVLAAGPIAASVFDPDSEAGVFKGADQIMIDERVAKAGYDLATRERLIAKARRLINDNWGLITLVAQALVERRNLSGDDVRKLISRSVATILSA